MQRSVQRPWRMALGIVRRLSPMLRSRRAPLPPCARLEFFRYPAPDMDYSRTLDRLQGAFRSFGQRLCRLPRLAVERLIIPSG
ncbi:hypothetical protein DN412_15500 [Cupriavidus lacunae]|uniref:Uncharacterized protein n=1 Tax=Cupriavidus lacunae TaxID=2666307 RepID=A0A370NV60_9BURK|nr:hypothetical protein DN412_15500 [Cupriavidus lacunae]